MKKLLPLLLVAVAALLSGCPDSKMPKVPPSTPEPKAAAPVPVDQMAGIAEQIRPQTSAENLLV